MTFTHTMQLTHFITLIVGIVIGVSLSIIYAACREIRRCVRENDLREKGES